MAKKVIPLLLILAAAGIGVGYHLAGKDRSPGDELYSGTLEVVQVEVRAEVGGLVVSAPVEEGSRVERDDVLCELKADKLELQVRGAEAELRAQQARLAALEKGARDQELEQVKLALNQARIQREKAERDCDKFERLYEQNAVSEFERDNARVMRDLARDQEARAHQQYDLVLAGVRDEELRAQLAVVDAVEAKLAYARLQLEDAIIKSPLSGRLIERYVEPGELLMPGGLVATIADYRRLEVNVYLPGDKVGAIRLGQRAEVMVDSLPDRRFSGRVIRKSMQAEFTPKNVQTKEERTALVYKVTLAVDNPEEHAVSGLPAEVKFLDEAAASVDEAATEPSPGSSLEDAPEPGSER